MTINDNFVINLVNYVNRRYRQTLNLTINDNFVINLVNYVSAFVVSFLCPVIRERSFEVKPCDTIERVFLSSVFADHRRHGPMARS